MMKEQIIKNIESLIGYLQHVKEQVANGNPEQIDVLDILQFVFVGLDATYTDIKEEFNLKEEE